jgi:threonyl-tRNA synthetase
MERFIAVLIEHTAGKISAVAYTPIRCSAAISEKFNDYAFDIAKKLKEKSIRCYCR